MAYKGLTEVFDIDKTVKIYSVSDAEEVAGYMDLRAVFYSMRMLDGHPLFAEVHQAEAMMNVHDPLIVRNRVDFHCLVNVKYSREALVGHAGLVVNVLDAEAPIAVQVLMTSVLHWILPPPLSLLRFYNDFTRFNPPPRRRTGDLNVWTRLPKSGRV